MNYLIDTHLLIWSLMSPERIAGSHVSLLQNPLPKKYISSISFWEISLKYGLGKLQLAGVTPEELVHAATGAGFSVLSVTTEELASSYRLEYISDHRDPFDRMLIWQCLKQDLFMLTSDPYIREYASVGLRLA